MRVRHASEEPQRDVPVEAGERPEDTYLREAYPEAYAQQAQQAQHQALPAQESPASATCEVGERGCVRGRFEV